MIDSPYAGMYQRGAEESEDEHIRRLTREKHRGEWSESIIERMGLQDTPAMWAHVTEVVEAEQARIQQEEESNMGLEENTAPWLYEGFPFVGQAVVQNPESRMYNHTMKGHVVSLNSSEDNLIDSMVSAMVPSETRDMGEWAVDVLWEDGDTQPIRVRHLILIDEPLEKVSRYMFSRGPDAMVVGNDMKSIDREVILRGRRILNKREQASVNPEAVFTVVNKRLRRMNVSIPESPYSHLGAE